MKKMTMWVFSILLSLSIAAAAYAGTTLTFDDLNECTFYCSLDSYGGLEWVPISTT